MLQPASALPAVPAVPAPWSLTGGGWIIGVRLPDGDPATTAFLPADLAAARRGPLAWLMFVDYAQAPCGPYHELLFIPGSCPFGDGRRHLTISRILVSSWDSVANGRANWGIPKDRADFRVQYGVDGTREDRIEVTSDGQPLARLALSSLPLPLPMPGGLVPASLRTMAQRFDGREYFYAPAANGWVRPGRVLSWQFNEALFPDLARGRVVAAFKVASFRMTFPVARIHAP